MRKYAWAVVALGLLMAVPAAAAAQQVTTGQDPVQLHGNYPNPFNPETTIPFSLAASVWDQGAPVVSLRIYNVLAQLVAVPILQGSGEELENIRLAWNGTGEYRAYWDGKLRGSGREAASGVYIYVLTVNGKRFSNKMTIVK